MATNEELLSVQRELADGRMLKPEERNRLIGRQSELNQTLASLDAQWEHLQGQGSRIGSSQSDRRPDHHLGLAESLAHRPVEWGDQLMQVADPSGPGGWKSTCRKTAWATLPTPSGAEEENLDVTYILAMEPGTTRHGKIEEVDRSAEVRGDEGNTVLIYVALDKAEMEQLRKEQKLKPGRRRDRESPLRPSPPGLRAAARRDRVRSVQNTVQVLLEDLRSPAGRGDRSPQPTYRSAFFEVTSCDSSCSC